MTGIKEFYVPNLKVGDTFEYEGKQFKCSHGNYNSCKGCYFREASCRGVTHCIQNCFILVESEKL